MESLPATNKSVSALQEATTPRQELRDAAREIREQVQREIRQAQQQQAEARGSGRAQVGDHPTPAIPPIPPVPGVVVRPGPEHVLVTGTEFPPFRRREEIPPQAVEMANAFFFTVVAIIIGLPIARAFARRMDRKAVPTQIPKEVTAQLGQLAQAVDAIALEVERISEGQRFTTRLLSEQRDAAQHTLPAGSDR